MSCLIKEYKTCNLVTRHKPGVVTVVSSQGLQVEKSPVDMRGRGDSPQLTTAKESRLAV